MSRLEIGMDSNSATSRLCMFCGGDLQLKYKGLFHPFKPDHGPFDMFDCSVCGSSQTEPLPSKDSLATLYSSFNDGLPNLHRTITSDDPQLAIYRLCFNRIASVSDWEKDDNFTWVDIGAGGGEFSCLMNDAFPNSRGVAIDLHSCPAALVNSKAITWARRDINRDNFSVGLPQFELVVSLSVWEHVLRPDLFVSNLLRLVRPGGMLYLLCPNNTSWASRLFGRRWPYFIPGEHLSMPSLMGARRCIQRQWALIHGVDQRANINVRPVMLPYTLRYLLRRLGIEQVGKLMPPGLSVPLPVGALEATVNMNRLGENTND